jgi:hypothetical protein
MTYYRNRIPGEKEINWCTFFKLNTGKGYCVVKLVDNETDNDSKRVKAKKQRLIVTFIHDSKVNEEVEAILNVIKDISGLDELLEDNKKNKVFNDLCQKYTSPAFTEKEIDIAKQLKEIDLLNILTIIKSSGGLLRREATNKLDKSQDVNMLIEKLIKLDLVKSEYVVLCKKTSEQINKAPLKESINLMGEHGIRCSRCNRLITEETIEEYLCSTDIANNMIDSSHWMTINLVDSLLKMGVPVENILVNISEGPEEIDAIVSFEENLLLFELKDSQFSIGHAYAFQSRIGIYEADIGIIWATKGVAPEVKEHFNRVKPDASINYIESIEELIPDLSEIIQDLHWQIASKQLKPLLSQSMILNNIPDGIIEDLKKSYSKNRKSSKQINAAK